MASAEMPAARTLGLDASSGGSWKAPVLDAAHAAFHASLPAPTAAVQAADDAAAVAERELATSSPSMLTPVTRDNGLLGSKCAGPGRASAVAPASTASSGAAIEQMRVGGVTISS